MCYFAEQEMSLELNLYVEQPPSDHTNEGAERVSQVLQLLTMSGNRYQLFSGSWYQKKKKNGVIAGEKVKMSK